MNEAGSFLSKLDHGDRAALQARWTMRRHGRRDVIIAQEDETRDVFFLIEGRARVTIYSEAGRAVAYRDLDHGQVFGELAAIDGKRRSASVMALEPVRLARLSEAAFRDLVDSQPSFRWALLDHLSTQLRRITERVYEFSTLVVRKRLIRELLRLAADNREGNRAHISPAPSHADLAARISTHREAVSREMSALAKQRLVEKRGRLILLHDLESLADMSDEEA